MRNITRYLLVVLLLSGLMCAATTSVRATSPQVSFANGPSQAQLRAGDGSPMPVCTPGKPCGNDQVRQLRAGDGSPMPVCTPGKPCGNDQVRQLRAGDGSPMPVCTPGKPCGNDQVRQLRAGDGSPMPVCTPGKPCNNDQLRADCNSASALALIVSILTWEVITKESSIGRNKIVLV